MSKDMRDQIPKEFFRGKHPVCRTVKDLIKQLQRLPGSLPIIPTRYGIEIVVYNVSFDAKVGFRTPEGDEG